MSTESLEEQLREAAERIAGSERLVVLTGAGVSRESGVPTFRDALDGLWARYDPSDLATPEAFRRNPKLVWDWYAYRRGLVQACHPNPAHYALAAFDDLLPQCVVITQNVDGFHQLAGSMDVIELHGNLHGYRCSAACSDATYEIPDYYKDSKTPPTCPNCGQFLRPDVVWFGENLPQRALNRASELCTQCDVLLIVGTAGMVNPAALLARVAKSEGAALIDINPNPNELTPFVDHFLRGKAGETLPRLLEAVRTLSASTP